MFGATRRSRRAPRAVAAGSAVLLAACSAAATPTGLSTPPAPARGAAESLGTIRLAVHHGAVTETWPTVPGADGYTLTATGAAPVRMPAGRTEHTWAAGAVPSDLTKATVAARSYTVIATSGARVLHRFTYQQACASTIYLAARGSGQNGLFSDAYARGLGNRGAALLARLRADLGLDQWQLPAIAIDYPATAVAIGGDLLSLARFFEHYNQSVADGVADTVRIVTREAADCPRSRFVLFGYSQGAQVIGSAYAALSTALRNRVADAVLFADAQYRPDDPRVTYLPTALSHVGILGARGRFPSGGTARVQSWCWSRDAVCQRPPSGDEFHGSIYDQYEVAAARLTARDLR